MGTDAVVRREWALQRIAHHKREIERLEAFIAMLDESESALSAPAPAQKLPRPDLRNKTLAGAMRVVLRDAGKDGLGPSQVAQALLDAGFSPPGDTPFATRVGNDLRRMARRKTGSVMKIGRGRYAIIPIGWDTPREGGSDDKNRGPDRRPLGSKGETES